MASLYTDVLYCKQGLAEGTTEDIPCPIGKRMVVTDIDCGAGISGFAPLLGFEDLVTGAQWFAAAVSGVLFSSVHLTTRQAFNYGGGFRVNAHIFNWDIRVTGWLLDVP